MNNTDLDILAIRFGNSSIESLRKDLKSGYLEAWQVPIVEELLRHKEEEAKNKPVKMYHYRKSPEGNIFKTYEVPDLRNKGWVDSPNKFKKNIKLRIINKFKSIRKLAIFLLWHDKLSKKITSYLIPTTIAIVWAIWQFDFGHFLKTGKLENEFQFEIKTILTKLIILAVVSAFIFLAINRYKKYNKVDDLNSEELSYFLHHMNESK